MFVNLWFPEGKQWEEEIVRKFGMDRYTLLYLERLNNKDLLYSTGNSAHLWGSLDGRGFEKKWIHVYESLSPFTVHLKLSQHC